MLQHFRITGSARYLPAHKIESEELDDRLGFPRGTTFARTGVQTRHQALAPENAATMAKHVIEQALASARADLSGVDLLIDASLCLQQPIPCNAALIQEALGPAAAGIPCMDTHASCLGFFAALRTVNGLFASESLRRIVVVCAETSLQGVNWAEPESACLMGDGAAAFVFEHNPSPTPCALAMETYAEGAHLCEVAGGGHRLPPFAFHKDIEPRYRFRMDGKALHKLASRHLPALVQRVLRDAACTSAELDVVPHQASGPAIELIARRLDIPRERFHVSIAEHGNLVSASIPFVLHKVRQEKPAGSRILLLGTAAGYTQAAGVITL